MKFIQYKLFMFASIILLGAMVSTGANAGKIELKTHGIGLEFLEDPVFAVAAARYLPKESRARKLALSLGWCGTPVAQFIQKYGNRIEEHRLILHARKMQARYAPEDFFSGRFVDESSCETKNCNGYVVLERLEGETIEIRKR